MTACLLRTPRALLMAGCALLCISGTPRPHDPAGRSPAPLPVVAALVPFPFLPPAHSPFLAEPQLPLADHRVCDQVAATALIAALEEARADFLFEVGKCVNAGGCFGDCLKELREDYRAARELAHARHAARRKVCDLLGGGRYAPEIDPDEFSPKVTNAYWPLKPGRTLVYHKKTDEGLEEIRVTTLKETIEIEGVACAIVRDVVKLAGKVIEDTDDWYAQHEDGDVWYFGEVARNFEDGILDNLDGSWRFGKEGALPGIVMKAKPRKGDAYRQEFLLNEAEDIGMVVSLGETVTVPAGTFKDCVKTEDTSPMEPGIRAFKLYAPGIGTVLEIDDEGRRTELVRIIDG